MVGYVRVLLDNVITNLSDCGGVDMVDNNKSGVVVRFSGVQRGWRCRSVLRNVVM